MYGDALLQGADNPVNWRKSAHSVAGGNCAEVASISGSVVVRDSMDPNGPLLRYPASSWESFLNSARGGRFGTIG